MATNSDYNLASAVVQRETGTRLPGRSFEHAVGNSRGLWQRMALQSLLVGHRGCVNHVEFNEQGDLSTRHSQTLRQQALTALCCDSQIACNCLFICSFQRLSGLSAQL